MELNKIEDLLEKYNEGVTSLTEEAQLRSYFSQETVPPHLESYKQLFSYFDLDAKQFLPTTIKVGAKNPKKIRWYASAAAALVILFTAFMSITTQKDNLTLSEDELYAYNETLKAFQLISNNMNKSNEALNSLNLISSSIEKGKNKIAMLEKFNISTNKIFKLKKK